MADDIMTAGAALERVRAIALQLPGATERESGGAPAFHVEDGESFACLPKSGDMAVIVRTSGSEEQAMLIEMDPTTYALPADLESPGWVAMRLNRPEVDWNTVADRIAISWELVAPRRLLEAGGR